MSGSPTAILRRFVPIEPESPANGLRLKVTVLQPALDRALLGGLGLSASLVAAEPHCTG
jgi:hypothetical protein